MPLGCTTGKVVATQFLVSSVLGSLPLFSYLSMLDMLIWDNEVELRRTGFNIFLFSGP